MDVAYCHFATNAGAHQIIDLASDMRATDSLGPFVSPKAIIIPWHMRVFDEHKPRRIDRVEAAGLHHKPVALKPDSGVVTFLSGRCRK